MYFIPFQKYEIDAGTGTDVIALSGAKVKGITESKYYVSGGGGRDGGNSGNFL